MPANKTDDKVIENEEIVENEDDLDEATAAASSLKAGGGSGDGTQKWTRSEVMAKIASKVAHMSMEDLSAFLAKTLEQVGKEDDKVKDTSGRNKASVAGKGAGKPDPLANAKKGLKEDVQELFDGENDLSEGFKENAATLFEAAVSSRVTMIQTELEEAMEAQIEEELGKEVETLHEKVNDYLDYIVKEWMEKNEVAVESNIKTQIVENFLSGLHTLFTEAHIDVPEDKIDLVAELTSKVEEMESKLDEATAENIKLTKIVEGAEREVAFDEVAEGLADTQAEKFKTLAEGIEYETMDDYTEKLKVIKEKYFNKKKSDDAGVLQEEVEIDPDKAQEKEEKVVPPNVQRYVNALNSTVGRTI